MRGIRLGRGRSWGVTSSVLRRCCEGSRETCLQEGPPWFGASGTSDLPAWAGKWREGPSWRAGLRAPGPDLGSGIASQGALDPVPTCRPVQFSLLVGYWWPTRSQASLHSQV